MPAPPPEPLRPEVATILATEHWSLLGTRSMTWNEIMSRISIYLTVISAFIVVLALVGQASDFGGPFQVLSIGLTSAALVMGTLTGLRINLASQEDAQLILAMNRLRAAYVQMAPDVAPYLTASTYDDEAGLMATYTLGSPRKLVAHIVGSTAFFITVVNTLVAGTLAALIAAAAQASSAVTVTVAVVAAVAYAGTQFFASSRMFRPADVGARFPTPRPADAAETVRTPPPAAP